MDPDSPYFVLSVFFASILGLTCAGIVAYRSRCGRVAREMNAQLAPWSLFSPLSVRWAGQTAATKKGPARAYQVSASLFSGLVCEMPIDAPGTPFALRTVRTQERAGVLSAASLLLGSIQIPLPRNFLDGSLRRVPLGSLDDRYVMWCDGDPDPRASGIEVRTLLGFIRDENISIAATNETAAGTNPTLVPSTIAVSHTLRRIGEFADLAEGRAVLVTER